MNEELTLLDPFLSFIGVAILIIVVAAIFSSRTRSYRKELTDMYVAGKIRQLAKKDDIDLEEEYKVFRLYHKKKRAGDKSLDYTLEMEMQDKIIDEANKKQYQEE